jgi:hypothetical protein
MTHYTDIPEQIQTEQNPEYFANGESAVPDMHQEGDNHVNGGNGASPESSLLTYEQLREVLRAAARREGSMNTLALKLGIDGSYMGLVINGKRKPGKKLLKALGLRQVTLYQPIEIE